VEAVEPDRQPALLPAVPSRGIVHTMGALFARDLRVMRREVVSLVLRTITQPVLFIFVFSFVMPKIASGGGTSPFSASSPGASGGMSFSTVLVPGLMATAVMFQGLMAVVTPLVMELSYTREIEDRVLAPVPVWALGVEKILAGSLQAVAASVLVFPLVMLIHAPGEAPQVQLSNWPLLLLVLVLSALCTSALGLLIGTVVDPRQLGTLLGVVFVPMTMLGCVYYPWQQLSVLPWLQYAVLANPLVYVSEALRAALTPSVPHLSIWIVLAVLVAGTVATTWAAVRAFARRLVA
jgi:ABC-2 type transport system permease protein